MKKYSHLTTLYFQIQKELCALVNECLGGWPQNNNQYRGQYGPQWNQVPPRPGVPPQPSNGTPAQWDQQRYPGQGPFNSSQQVLSYSKV